MSMPTRNSGPDMTPEQSRFRSLPIDMQILEVLVRGEMFGRQIRDEVCRRYYECLPEHKRPDTGTIGAYPPAGELYCALERLEEQRFVISRDGESDPEGGPRRRYFQLTGPGATKLQEFPLDSGGLAFGVQPA